MIDASSVVLVGHRGVGKTTSMLQLKEYLPHYDCLDLDSLIEQQTGQSVSNLFYQLGETGFREIERRIYSQVTAKKPRRIISVGAGFDPATLNADDFVIWLQRRSDQWGRIFIDRPRLNRELDVVQEFKVRKTQRDPRFYERADFILNLPEGVNGQIFSTLLFKHSAAKTAYITLTEWHLQKPRRLEFLKTFAHLGFELRDDLLNQSQMLQILNQFTNREIIISIRCPLSSEGGYFVEAVKGLNQNRIRVDLATEVSQNNILNASIVSCHSNDNSVFKNIKASLYKWSPEIESFQHLIDGHNWFLQSPKDRLFFPRSKSGKWCWYRKWIWHRQSFNFVNNEILGYLDQPTLLDSMTVTADQAFAAVLGDPVTHSKSPSFHESFFKKYQMSFFAIHITKPDFELALKFLTDLGLRAAAVTSPLKILANEYCFEKSLLSAQLESVNTLTYSDGHWIGANTDKDGLEATIKRLEIGSQDSVAVWGGGGVLPVIKSLVPNAEYYSSSSEKPLAAGFVGLIWAAPPDRKIPVMTAGSVKWVLDLNYREDSRAKEFAMKSGARYFSGLEMFEIQAHRQQQIWSQFFERK